MKKKILLCLLFCVCFLFSSCGEASPKQGENAATFNRVISCHYQNDFHFEGLYEACSDTATGLADNLYLQTEYSGYILNDLYKQAFVQNRISQHGEARAYTRIFTYQNAGKKFDIRLTDYEPKYISAISHKPTNLGTKSAVIYKYGEETFAKYSYMEYVYEISCTGVSDEDFLGLINIVIPDGACAVTGQTTEDLGVSTLQKTYQHYYPSKAEDLPNTETACSDAGVPKSIRNFEILSAQKYSYTANPTASDYVFEFSHKDGGKAVIKTSATPGDLPQWWQVASNDNQALVRLGRGYAIIFENKREIIARCYFNERYYEVQAEGISGEEVKGLLSAICS